MIDVLVAIGILFAIGLVAAVILALASHYMNVPTDEKAVKIRDCLPGANCGACGYTGCDGYAEALAKGKAAPNLCIPGGTSVSSAVSEILGVEASEMIKMGWPNSSLFSFRTAAAALSTSSV